MLHRSIYTKLKKKQKKKIKCSVGRKNIQVPFRAADVDDDDVHTIHFIFLFKNVFVCCFANLLDLLSWKEQNKKEKKKGI